MYDNCIMEGKKVITLTKISNISPLQRKFSIKPCMYLRTVWVKGVLLKAVMQAKAVYASSLVGSVNSVNTFTTLLDQMQLHIMLLMYNYVSLSLSFLEWMVQGYHSSFLRLKKKFMSKFYFFSLKIYAFGVEIQGFGILC